MDFVLTDPDCVRDILSGRVVVYCTADDPGRRSSSGLVRRGSASASQVTDEKIHAKTQADARLHRLAQNLAELGIPVLELNLDAPVDENLSRVAFFLTAAGIHSPKINRFAARANRAGRDPILFPRGTRESGGD